MRKGPRKKFIRVTLDLTPESCARLEQLQQIIGSNPNKAQLIRQALQLYEYIAKRTSAGDGFKVVKPDGTEESLVFFVAEVP